MADAGLVRAAVEIVGATDPVVRERRGWVDEDVSGTQRRSLTAEVKRSSITEVQVATGLSTVEATSLITLAMGPRDLFGIVVSALERGETCWPQVRRFVDMAFSSTRALTDDQRLLVATVLFGRDPEMAAPEKLDESGQLLEGHPWPHALYGPALLREITACEGIDVGAERERRARARAERRAWIRAHDDGTATLTVRGPLVPILGAWARFDHIARNLRAGGADNTFDQLVVDSMLAVLGHGSLDLPEPSTLGDLSPEELDDLIAVVNGTPKVTLQVVVPVDALGIGHPVCGSCFSDLDGADPGQAGVAGQAGDQCETGDAGDQVEPTAIPEKTLVPPSGAGRDGPVPGRGLVAEIIGSHPAFLTPGHVRELFYGPDTTMFRMLVNPPDGRIVERTIKAYRPDPDMRRQVRAADVYSRAPWSRLTGRSLEIDHVVPYLHADPAAGGPTGELHLASLDKRTHVTKTLGLLALSINERRDLTFTTLLGQIAGSRVHDYRQYTATLDPDDLASGDPPARPGPVADGSPDHPAPGGHDPEGHSPEDHSPGDHSPEERDVRRDDDARALYGALARDPRFRRRPGCHEWLTIDHTEDGRRRPGPPPGGAGDG
ncbi:hypothetical protein [Ornithinimicrobium panacihumi]|uniref:hypothetical protein n=1 Tax=Ornithinimicrobium panacihumi TaxID=2008449 RepID=UPI003F8BB631